MLASGEIDATETELVRDEVESICLPSEMADIIAQYSDSSLSVKSMT